MGRGEPAPPVIPPPPPPVAPAPKPSAPAVPASAPAPVASGTSKVVMPQTGSRPAPAPPRPASAPIAPAPQPKTAAPALPPLDLTGPALELPLRSLWPKLNPALTQIATGHPGSDAQLKLPLSALQPMLARGAVKFSYDHFRQLAPAALFPAQPGKDLGEIEIPLAEVLSRATPELFARRPQKTIEVPADIGPVFGAGGANLRVVDPKAKPVAPAAPAIPAPAVAAPVEAPKPPPEPPKPLVFVPPPPSAAPVVPIAVEPPSAPKPLQPEPLVNEPIRAPKLDPSLASLKSKPAPAPAPQPPAALSTSSPTPPAAKGGTFSLPLTEVAPHWESTGKLDLAALKSGTLEIPVPAIESALKTGKLVFPWREVRSWVSGGATPPALSDETLIELPLSVVAPKFMAWRGASAPRKRVQVSDEIPDLFAQKKGALPSPVAAPSVPAALPIPSSAPHAHSVARPALDFGEIFGQPDKKNWSFPEVTQKTVALRGVAGALIATSDGLIIAGNWPDGVQTEAVAAFIPQMYSRMVQCTKELKLGEPENFTLLIESVPLQIFKTGGNYFAVLGRAGENLPKAQLTALASRLANSQPVK